MSEQGGQFPGPEEENDHVVIFKGRSNTIINVLSYDGSEARSQQAEVVGKASA